jgi:5'(3')-deoxyribonucleotidase
MRVGVDIDGVLADFNSAFIALIVKHTGKDLFPPRPFDIPIWNYPQHFGYTDAEVNECFDLVKKDSMFWLNLRPYAGTYDVLRGLYFDYLYFITDRPGVDTKYQSEEWLKEHGLEDTPTVLVSPNKGLLAKCLKLDYYIDDKVENCIDVLQQSPDTKCYMQARTWNHPVRGVTRVFNMYEFLEGIKNGNKVSV